MYIASNFLAPYSPTDTALVFINKFGRRVKGVNVCKYLDYGVKENILWVLLESQVKLEFSFDNDVEALTASIVFKTAIDTLTLNCPTASGTGPTPSPTPITITLDNYLTLVNTNSVIALQWYDIVDINNAFGRGINEVYRCLALTTSDGYPSGLKVSNSDKVILDVINYKMLDEIDVSNNVIELNQGNAFDIDEDSINIVAASATIKAINSKNLYVYHGILDVEDCNDIVVHNSDIKLIDSNNCSFADVGILDLSALGVFDDIFVNTSTTIGKNGIENHDVALLDTETTLLAYQNKIYQKLSGTLDENKVITLKNIGDGNINAEFILDIDPTLDFDSYVITVKDDSGDILLQVNSGYIGTAIKFKYNTETEKFFLIPDSSSGGRKKVDITVVTALQTVFTNVLTTESKNPSVSELVINGQMQSYGVDYTISGKTITWISTDFTLNTTDKIYIIYE